MYHYYNSIDNGYFTYPNFYRAMVKQFNGAKFVEVGSWVGQSAAYLGVEIINQKKDIQLLCVDTFNGSIEHQEFDIIKSNRLLDVFKKNIAPVKDVVSYVQTTSVEAASIFEDNSLDLVFIDASHDYENVKNDITAWLPKVKLGGIISGHDYFQGTHGVCKAVDEIFSNIEKDFIHELVWYTIKGAN